MSLGKLFFCSPRNWIPVFDGRNVWANVHRGYHQVSVAPTSWLYAFFRDDGTLFRRSRTALKHFIVHCRG